MQTTKITLPNGEMLMLKSTIYSNDIDLEKLLRIDLANIAAEIVTIPIVLNHFGIILADLTNAYNESKINLNIQESKVRDRILSSSAEDKKKPPRVEDLDSMIRSDKTVVIMKKTLYKRQKDMDYINSIYWSLKSKDDKLNKLVNSFQQYGDVLESLINTKLKHINCVDIKTVQPLMK